MSLLEQNLRRLAGSALSIALFISSGHVLAQDTAPAESAPADSAGAPQSTPANTAAPADTTPAAETAPADTAQPAADAAPADAAPATAEAQTAETIPVTPAAAKPKEDLKVDEGATKLEAIEVTGSRIKRTDFETAQPVTVVRREDIDRTGLVNIGDLLQKVPAAGSALNRQFNNGGNGQVNIDLRNLGATRVLVLVNGHRWVSGVSFGGSEVDLNTIPISIIDRIEVLKDGASAIYGSDAITGVVNIITRKDFSGVTFGGQANVFDKGDGLQQAYNFSVGNIAGKTNMFLDLGFVRQNAVFAGARDYSKIPLFGTGLTRGSAFTPRGTILVVTNQNNASALNASDPRACNSLANLVAGGDLPFQVPNTLPQGSYLCDVILRQGRTIAAGDQVSNPAVAANYKYRETQTLDDSLNDAYNYAPINYLLTPFEQNSLYGQINHQFLDNLAGSITLLYNVSKTERQLAETPLLQGNIGPPYDSIYVSAQNIYNPFGHDIGHYAGQGDPNADPGLGIGYGLVARRFTELGPRFLSRNTKTTFLHTTLNGNFDALARVFAWDFGYSLGRADNSNLHKGDLNLDRVRTALGPDVNCRGGNVSNPQTGAVERVSGAPGCVPLNLFGGPGTITKEMLNYISYTAASSALSQTHDAILNFSTEIPELTGILAAPMGIAFGVEYRDVSFEDQPDAFVASGISSTNIAFPTKGQVRTSEAFTEFRLPILAGLPYAERLDLDLAARYTKYSNFAAKNTAKVGVEYKPITDLLLRSTYSQAFRAPDVGDLYLGGADGFPAVSDPCANSNASQTTKDNCAADGASGAPQVNSQILTHFKGNPNLQPETANSFTTGFVYSPNFVPDLNITAVNRPGFLGGSTL